MCVYFPSFGFLKHEIRKTWPIHAASLTYLFRELPFSQRKQVENNSFLYSRIQQKLKSFFEGTSHQNHVNKFSNVLRRSALCWPKTVIDIKPFIAHWLRYKMSNTKFCSLMSVMYSYWNRKSVNIHPVNILRNLRNDWCNSIFCLPFTVFRGIPGGIQVSPRCYDYLCSNVWIS